MPCLRFLGFWGAVSGVQAMGQSGRRALEELCLCQACRAEAKGSADQSWKAGGGDPGTKAEAAAGQGSGPATEGHARK